MSVIHCKLMLIKKLLSRIEDDCRMTLLLRSDSDSTKDMNAEYFITIQVCFEVIQHIMNMDDMPDSIKAIYAYVTRNNHVQRVELYSTDLPIPSDKIEFEMRWLED